MSLWVEHPLRRELHGELHARPSLYFDGDTDVWHVAIMGETKAPLLPDRLIELTETSASARDTHGTGKFGKGRLKWEAHTEFITVTLVLPATPQTTRPLPKDFFDCVRQIDGKLITAARVLVRKDQGATPLKTLQPDFVASKVGGGDAQVHSNFRLTEDGVIEFYLVNHNLNAYRAGRMVRRLLEIETYRMMALLGFPVARQTVTRLAAYDQRLGRLIEQMRSEAKVDKELLSDVTQLSSEILEFSAGARHRFGATKAYAEIVASRMLELREERVEDRQRICTFIDRRFQPAIRSVHAAGQRLDDLTERVGLASDLLRTTIQVQLEEQNASLLASMERRTLAQVHIQQAVEGFSVIAILTTRSGSPRSASRA
jgi:uncharacterized membrane-anchored protein